MAPSARVVTEKTALSLGIAKVSAAFFMFMNAIAQGRLMNQPQYARRRPPT